MQDIFGSIGEDVSMSEKIGILEIRKVDKDTEEVAKLLNFVENFSWVDVKEHTLRMIQNWEFTDWETMFVALIDGKVVGMASIMKTDYYPLPEIYPWISSLFVSEEYRGNRISEKLIDFANDYAKKCGFDRTYIPTEHIGLYEKFGYHYLKDIINYGNGTDRLYVKELNTRPSEHIFFETERMLVREWSLEDKEELLKIMSDVRVHTYTKDKNNPWDVLRVEEYIHFMINKQFRALDNYHGAVIEKATNQLIGLCGLNPYKQNEPEIEWKLGVAFWGKGYATELGKQMVKEAFSTTNIKGIYGMAQPGNKASIRVLEKIGMQYIGNRIFRDCEDEFYYLPSIK